MTVADLIKQSLRLLKVCGPTETPGATELADGLVILNEMIDAYNVERLFIYQTLRDSHNLTASQASYTIGTGGDFNQTRPVKIESAGVILDSSVASPIEIPLEVLLNYDEWASIYLKLLPSTYPRKLYYNPTFPLGTIYLWPVPTGSALQLILGTWGILTAFATTATTVSVPPGYQTLLRTNFALWVAEEYGVTPTDSVILQAQKAVERVKDLNISKEVPVLTTSYPQTERGRFNIILGDWKQ